ncbi:MAG TPA: HEPN domain-containing protein [Pirellulales bacterium]|nr:HEPN domain-containing protein [Pirellulales bacterium]
MSGDDFIAVASRWAAHPAAGEASFRSAVSRAYYGAFHVARRLLRDLGFDIPAGSNSHSLVRVLLLESGHAQAVEAGRFLKDLHADRIKADYRLDKGDAATQAAARLAVETASAASSLIRSCAAEPARTEFKGGVERYKKKLEQGREKGSQT